LIIEQDIIQGCIAEKREFQKKLYETLSDKMLFVCYRYCKNKEEAEDVLQDGFIKVFKYVHTFRFEGSFEDWVRRIMINTAIAHLRKKKHIYSFSSLKNIIESPQSDYNIIGRLDEKKLLKTINLLPNGYRTVLNMYVIEGYSHKEIGKALGITEGTSKSQLYKSKFFLKTLLNKYLDIELKK
jgi:RNA polymerase sigma factor (sigma-70 family)